MVCELGSTKLTTALGWFNDFLDTHPDEVVVLFIEDEVSPEDTARPFEESGILRYAYVHRPGEPFPTLRRVIEDDKRLFVMAERNAGTASSRGTRRASSWPRRTPTPSTRAAELKDPGTCFAQPRRRQQPLFQLNHWVEKVPRSPAWRRR